MMLTTLAIFAAQQPQDNTVKVALVGVLGVIASGLIAFFTARYSANRSKEASKETTKVTERQVDVSEWTALVTSLQTETSRLGGRVASLEVADTAKNTRIGELETADRVKTQLISDLENKVREGDAKYRLAVKYIKDVVIWAQQGADRRQTNPPTAPVDIAADLNN